MLQIQSFMGDQENFSGTKILYLPPLSLNGGELHQWTKVTSKPAKKKSHLIKSDWNLKPAARESKIQRNWKSTLVK